MPAPSATPVSLVTGSARGIGLAVARHLRHRGDRVHVVWRTAGERSRELEREFGPRAHRADLLVEKDARRLVADVLALDGAIHCAVHAVGDYVSAPLDETTPADLEHMWRSNVQSSFLFFDAVRPALREARGKAVFFGTSGLDGFRARRRTAAYAAAKSALLVLVKSWALEEAPHGVTVNVVSPGHVPHPDAHADTLDEQRLEKIPLGRPGTPEDVARAVDYLTSDAAGYVTGTELLVGGGWML